MSAAGKAVRAVVERRGWVPGSSLEDRAALAMSSWRLLPADVAQQYRVGRYRLDFAFVSVKVAIEVDGWQHLRPENAARDAARDAFLRSEGWIVLRVDERNGEESFLDQLCRAVQVANLLRDWQGERVA